MRYLRLDLLTLLISLFILSSCSSPDSVGLDVDPANMINTKSIDITGIKVQTVEEDPIITSGLSQHPFGFQKDAEFGIVESNLAFAVNLPSNTVSFGTTPILDSAVLILKYGDSFYGDSVSSNYAINVNQLDTAFNTSQGYTNKKTWTSTTAAIGTKSVSKFALRDSVTIKQYVLGKGFISRKMYPHLRIKLSNSFVQNNFLNASSTTLSTAENFNKFIKGFYLTINKTSSSGLGGIVHFNLAQTDSSRLEIYTRGAPTTSTKDTIVTKFGIYSNTTAANIKHDYSTAVKSQLASSASFDNIYLRPLAGLRGKVNFTDANIATLKSLGNIAINRAELVVTVAGPTPAFFDPAPRLALYRTDIAGQRQPLPDNNIGQTSGYPDARDLGLDGAFGGFYNKTTKQYKFIVTSYIEDILKGRLTQYDTYLAPIKSTTKRVALSKQDISTDALSAARVIIGGTQGPYQIKLNVIYTKLSD